MKIWILFYFVALYNKNKEMRGWYYNLKFLSIKSCDLGKEDCKVNTHYIYIPRFQYALCSLKYTRGKSIIPTWLQGILSYYK